MEPLSSYTISNVSAQQVLDFVELSKLAGVTISYDMMKIILEMLSNGIEPEAVYQLCVDIKNERKKQKKKEKITHVTH